MARPSKLTPAQWAEVERRLVGGEGVRDLAKLYEVNASAISRRFPQQTQQAVRSVAQQLAQAQTALAALPLPQQQVAVDLASALQSINNNTASAAVLGSDTSHMLHRMANGEARRLVQLKALDVEGLKAVAAITRTANEAAAMGMGLISANKGAIEKASANDGLEGVSAIDRTARVAQIIAAAQRRKEAADDGAGHS